MPLAWSYARTSTVRQAGSDKSGMGRQAEALERWLLDHPEYELAEALLDAGVSAGRGRHRKTGALSRFIQGGRSGAVPPGSVLVVESLTRFSREAERSVLETLLRDVWGQGLGLAICADGGAVLTGELIDQEPHRLYGLLGSISQARREWEERSRRSKGAAVKAAQLQDQGVRTRHPMPWWIKRSADGGMEIDPAGRAVIERAVELALAGQGASLIAAALNQEGWPPPPTATRRNQYGTVAAATWTHGRVSTLFGSKALIGTLVRKGLSPIAAYYPSVLTQDRWNALRASLENRSKLKGQLRGGAQKCHFLFQTAARCGVCGGPLSYHPPGRGSRPGHPGWVACRTANRRGAATSCTNRGYIGTDELETHCLTRLSSADWGALLHRPEDDQDRHELEQAAEQLGGERDRLQAQLEQAEHRAEGLWLENASEERVATVERALTRLRADLAEVEAQHAEAQQCLAVARSRPSVGEAAAIIHSRVREFWDSIGTATPAERLAFNRWLLARQIAFKVHPRPADGGDRLVDLVVEGRPVGTEPLAAIARGLARGLALVDPLAQQVTDEGATLVWLRSTGEVGPAVEVAVARMQGADWADVTVEVRAHRVVAKLLDDYRAQGRLDGIPADEIEAMRDRLVERLLLERSLRAEAPTSPQTCASPERGI